MCGVSFWDAEFAQVSRVPFSWFGYSDGARMPPTYKCLLEKFLSIIYVGTAHTHTMAKGPSNKNFCHSMSFSILWGGKKPKKNELFLGNEGNYDHERNIIHEYDQNL